MLRGIRTIKIKFDPDGSLEQSLKMLTRLRETYPDLRMRADLGGMLTEVLELGQDPSLMALPHMLPTIQFWLTVLFFLNQFLSRNKTLSHQYIFLITHRLLQRLIL